ncbi:MAG: penicillin-binding protein 2 [Rhodobacteraceae bacterium]|nr:penicillin-binding protein 2 [Paracoccaceae bacterium]
MRRTPRDTEQSARIISRRGLLLGGAQLGFMGLLGLRMRYMQVEQADEFRLLAEENRINIRLLPPTRGLIYDRNGVILAENEPNYRIVLVREDAGDVDAVLDRLDQILNLDPETLDNARREIARRSPFVPVTVADRLSWEQFAEVAVNGPALPGVSPEVGLSRIYPLDTDFSHIVGYVGPVSDYDLTKGYLREDKDPLLEIPRFQVGKTGVEARMEHDLRGGAGTKRIEVNAVGRVMRELGRQEGRAGTNLRLTIDSMLQNYLQARLGDSSASAVVMDTENGDILAIGSAPSFDPNKFVRGISVPDYKALIDNEYRPLANKSVQGVYPPGSTFKMITALAALEDGVIGPEDTVWCPGHKEVGGRKFHCWNRGGHGDVDLYESLTESCDVYFYDVAERVGIEKIAVMARRLGLGQRYELPVSAVKRGLMPNKAWKLEHRDAEWVVGDTLNSGIGQGFVLASPLQLAVMTARLASGRALLPRMVKSAEEAEQPAHAAPRLDINPEHLRLVRKGMYGVINSRSGTAYGSRIVAEDIRLAGKTGTSQVFTITAKERAEGIRRQRDLPWNKRDHALFVSFAPYDAPNVACSVVVEHGGGGSLVAAPIARDIILQALYGGKPPLSAYPSSQRGTIRTRQKKLILRDPATLAGERSRA